MILLPNTVISLLRWVLLNNDCISSGLTLFALNPCRPAIKALSEFHDYDFSKYKGEQRRLKIARNLVDYEAGKTIFQTALGIINNKNKEQTKLF